MMKKTDQTLAGLAVAGGAIVAWPLVPGWERFGLQEEKSPLAFVEHSHWGLASLVLAKLNPEWGAFFNAAGATLILSEFFQAQPFGIGKSEWEWQGNVALNFILGGLLLAFW